MNLKINLAFAILLVFTSMAQANSSIVVGNHPLLPNTPGQIVDIVVIGSATVKLVNFNSQIADGGPLAGGSILAPTYTGSLTVPGAIFATNNNGVQDVTSGLGGHEIVWLRTNTLDGTVNATGLLARLTFDTTGFTSGSWPLIMDGLGINGTTWFDGPTGPVTPTITNGTISIVPEPSSFVLGLFAAAGLAAWGWRRRTC